MFRLRRAGPAVDQRGPDAGGSLHPGPDRRRRGPPGLHRLSPAALVRSRRRRPRRRYPGALDTFGKSQSRFSDLAVADGIRCGQIRDLGLAVPPADRGRKGCELR